MRALKQQEATQIISFEAKLSKTDPWTILRLPASASAKLPFRIINATAEDMVTPAIKPVKELPKPDLPADLKKNAITATPRAHALWQDITTTARWDGFAGYVRQITLKRIKDGVGVACQNTKLASKDHAAGIVIYVPSHTYRKTE